MKIYSESSNLGLRECTSYIMIGEMNNTVIGITLNKVGIFVKNNIRVGEFVPSKELLEKYKEELKEGKQVFKYNKLSICKYHNIPQECTDEDI